MTSSGTAALRLEEDVLLCGVGKRTSFASCSSRDSLRDMVKKQKKIEMKLKQ